jgi:membrane-associated protein
MNYIAYLQSTGYTLGYILLFLIIFTESGLFFGFFLPGDSLLFTLGVVSSQGHFSAIILVLVASVAAITGVSVGYAFGKKVGPSLFTRENSRFFKKSHLKKAHEFYEKYGKKTLVLARFVPVARTFAPILAGVSNMDYPTFLLYNVIGGVSWVFLMIFGGYFLGNHVPNVDHYILPIIFGVIVVSGLPAVFQYMKAKRNQATVGTDHPGK